MAFILESKFATFLWRSGNSRMMQRRVEVRRSHVLDVFIASYEVANIAGERDVIAVTKGIQRVKVEAARGADTQAYRAVHVQRFRVCDFFGECASWFFVRYFLFGHYVANRLSSRSQTQEQSEKAGFQILPYAFLRFSTT